MKELFEQFAAHPVVGTALSIVWLMTMAMIAETITRVLASSGTK